MVNSMPGRVNGHPKKRVVCLSGHRPERQKHVCALIIKVVIPPKAGHRTRFENNHSNGWQRTLEDKLGGIGC